MTTLAVAAIPPCIPSSCIRHSKGVVSQVIVYHGILRKPFVSFPAQPYPIAGGFSSESGIPRSLIIDSCRILTGTHTENVLICRKDDSLSSFEFDILPAGDYAYVVGSLDQPVNYGVYTDFTTWHPPFRSQVPDHWFTQQYPKQASNFNPQWNTGPWPIQADMHSVMSEKAKALDSYVCSLTLIESESAEGCHVVPVECKTFYDTRDISSQLLPPGPIPRRLTDDQMVHDIRNFVTLGRTIHRIWDLHIMGFYPFSSGHYVAYFFEADGNAELFHLKHLHLTDHTDPYLMYVRFALTVFEFRLGNYKGDQPTDALPSCVPVSTRTRNRNATGCPRREYATADRSGGRGGAESGMAVDSEDDVESTEDETSSDDGIPLFVLQSLVEEAEAEGKMLSEDLQTMVGPNYSETEKTRINNVRMEYLKNNPAVGISPD